MHRFFVSALSQNTCIRLEDGEEFHHLSRVLRLKEGTEVELIDGRGALARVVIDSLHRSFVVFKMVSFLNSQVVSRPRLILACAIPKRCKIEDIIDKAVQLGVDEFFPLITERTEVRPREGAGERYRRVALSAVKQSRRLYLPVTHDPVSFSAVLSILSKGDTRVFVPWLEGERQPFVKALSGCYKSQALAVMIGPEGDFTADEIDQVVALGATPVSLGENVLRVDTAAIAVMALVGNFHAHFD